MLCTTNKSEVMMQRVLALVVVLVSSAVVVLSPASCESEEVPFKNEKPDWVPYEEPPAQSPNKPYVVSVYCKPNDPFDPQGPGQPINVWSDGSQTFAGGNC